MAQTLDIASFRLRFPEFKDSETYSDAQIQTFWDMATLFIDSEDSPCRSLTGKQLALALQYMTAHLLTLALQAADSSAGSGGVGADQVGFTTSATIGDISVSKLAPPATDGWQFWLASTPAGQALWALLELLAVGGFAIGGLPEREGFRKVGGVFW